MVAGRRAVRGHVPQLVELLRLSRLLDHVDVVVQALVEAHPDVLKVPGDVDLPVRVIEHRVGRHVLDHVVLLPDLFLLPQQPLLLLFQPPGAELPVRGHY